MATQLEQELITAERFAAMTFDFPAELVRGEIVETNDRTVQVFRPDARPRELASSDTLESPDVLPGFSCSVAAFFEGI